jgi:uncharacterized protein
MRIVGDVGDPPLGITADGVRILVTHQLERLRGQVEGTDVIIFAHTHRPSVRRDETGRLFINPGETSGWTYRKPSIAILETGPLEATIVPLPELPPMPQCE